MKRLVVLVVAFGLLFLTVPAHAESLTVTVSVAPLKYFTQAIGGDRVNVEVMVAPGASPAAYEPKPRQMVALTRSKLYISIGVPFERAWLPRIQGANPDMTVVRAASGIELMPMATHNHGDGKVEHDHGHGDRIMDPHVWNSPRAAKRIAATIVSALIEADVSGSHVYQQNYERLLAKISALDTEISDMLTDCRSKRFLTYHPSWGYFARDYGLVQIPVELEGKEPGPRELAEVIKLAKRESIKAVFIQPQFSSRSAQTIAEAIGGRVVVADPLAENWADNILGIARQFSEALR